MTSTRSICVAGIWSRPLLCVRPERRPLMSTVTLGLPRRLMPPVGLTATDGTPFSTSLADGKPCAVLRYGAESPFPWRHVTDELRSLGDGKLLGMTVIDVPVLRGLAFPFLLVREDP